MGIPKAYVRDGRRGHPARGPLFTLRPRRAILLSSELKLVGLHELQTPAILHHSGANLDNKALMLSDCA